MEVDGHFRRVRNACAKTGKVGLCGSRGGISEMFTLMASRDDPSPRSTYLGRDLVTCFRVRSAATPGIPTVNSRGDVLNFKLLAPQYEY